MNATVASRVRAAFPEHADTVIGLLAGEIDPETYPAVQAWVDRCYHRPRKGELILEALDTVLGGSGVEGWTDDTGRSGVSYVNMGETYATTILLISPRNGRRRFHVGSWGDYVEAHGETIR